MYTFPFFIFLLQNIMLCIWQIHQNLYVYGGSGERVGREKREGWTGLRGLGCPNRIELVEKNYLVVSLFNVDTYLGNSRNSKKNQF